MASSRPGERGAALLTILLLVAVIAVIAAGALEKMRLATRLGANAIALDQARAYAMATETLATTRIDAILSRDAARVTLAGGWSGTPFALPIPQGVATATITDGGNCFNLNGLVVEESRGTYRSRAAAVMEFSRLMRLLGITQQTGSAIAAATADWIDSDGDAQPQGAEDARYARSTQAYRTANTLMADASELRSVSGVTPEIFATLAPWVCAQPRAMPSRINVNTLLPEQAVLLAMIFPDTLDIGRARQVLLERPPQGFTSTLEFLQRPALQGATAGPDVQQQTAITTTWFTLRTEVALGGVALSQRALIDARQQPSTIVARAWEDPA